MFRGFGSILFFSIVAAGISCTVEIPEGGVSCNGLDDTESCPEDFFCHSNNLCYSYRPTTDSYTEGVEGEPSPGSKSETNPSSESNSGVDASKSKESQNTSSDKDEDTQKDSSSNFIDPCVAESNPCHGKCGKVLDECGNSVSCGECPDNVDGNTVDGDTKGDIDSVEGGSAGTTTDSTTDNSVDTSPDENADIEINLAHEHQRISGFGGTNLPAWIDDLTRDQVDIAFGNGPGQIGMSILRIRVPYEPSDFQREVSTATRAISHGAIVMASPWTPPPRMKTNSDIMGGRLDPLFYGEYADHLLSFRNYMAQNGAPIYAISVQNTPDTTADYDSCSWTTQEIISWVVGQASKFGNTRLIVAESTNFNQAITDPILNDPIAEPLIDIIGGHIYGGGLFDYPLAREKGKEVWMTEHYTDSDNDANFWPDALDVAKEIHDCMAANFSAYIWWHIRRFYGPITDDGRVSKRGYMMAQYAKYVRPGFMRVDASVSSRPDVYVTAYKNGTNVVVVVVNMGSVSRNLTLHIQNGTVGNFTKIISSGEKNLSEESSVVVTDNIASITLEEQSVSTFISDLVQ